MFSLTTTEETKVRYRLIKHIGVPIYLYRRGFLRLLAGKSASYTSDFFKKLQTFGGVLWLFLCLHSVKNMLYYIMKYIILGLFLLFISGCAGSLGAITSALGGADFITRLFTD